MLCELEVNNIGTYVELITRIDAEQQYRMWFRGQSDYSWGLVPSVQRKDGIADSITLICFRVMLSCSPRASCVIPACFRAFEMRLPKAL